MRLGLLLLLLAGCVTSRTAVLPEPEEPTGPTVLPGVDSVFAALAAEYALIAQVADIVQLEAAERALEAGQALYDLADSLKAQRIAAPDTTTVSIEALNEATIQFNAGAEALEVNALSDAAEAFEAAIEASPTDADALFWLSQTRRAQFEQSGDTLMLQRAIQALETLVGLHAHRHDFVAHLAGTHALGNSEEAWHESGVLYYEAAKLLMDEAMLPLTLEPLAPDTAGMFAYLTRAGNAFVEANDGLMALGSLEEANAWALTAEDEKYVSGWTDWISWDADVRHRKRFDALLTEASVDGSDTVPELRDLLENVTLVRARRDVTRALALEEFNSGLTDEGVARIAVLWKEVGSIDDTFADDVREDFGQMAYAVGLNYHSEGDLQAAMQYFLQSESTGFQRAPEAALMLARVLRNNLEASMEAAERAMAGIDQMDLESKRALLSHMVELHRRAGNRDKASELIALWQTMQAGS